MASQVFSSGAMDVITFLLAVLLLELTPGPNMGYLATLALSRGRAAGLIATAGVAVGLAVHATMAGLGAGVLIQQYPLLRSRLMFALGKVQLAGYKRSDRDATNATRGHDCGASKVRD